MKTRRVYRFGPFQLDATAKVLLKDGEPVRLARKAVETLLALVENAGQVLTKEELMAAIWPDRVVDEANLAQNVAVIRRSLGAEKGAPGYIETFPGRGYRILGPISVAEEPTGVQPAQTLEVPHPERRIPYALLALALGALLAGVAVLYLWRRATVSGVADELHRVPVVRLAGKEYQPAISPDGARVAFIWESRERPGAAIWIKEGEAPPRRLTREQGVYCSPAWSPDGRRLACLRFHESSGAVVIVSLDGGPEQVVATLFPSRYGLANRHLDWSPDGQWLAVDDTASPHEALSIYLVSLATGEKKRLTDPEDVFIGDVDPRFSPDGRSLCFVRVFHRGWQELFLLRLGEGAPRQLTSDGKQVSSHDWMPESKTLVYSSDRSGEFRIWRLPVGPPAGSAPLATGIYGDFPIQLSVARRASALVYSVLQQDLNIWRLDLQAASPAERWQRIIASSGQDASPQYSPDGSRICFRSDRSGEEQLWISDHDGINAVQITRGALWPSVGRWSPDGQAVVFNNARSGEIYLARLGPHGGWSVRSIGTSGYHPVFSPDGRWIYAGTMSSIVRIPAAGGPASEVARTRGISLGVSGDGRHVYFVREAAGTELWRLDTGTGQLEKILEGLLPYCSSCWALTERGVYYLGARQGWNGRQALYFHAFAGGRDKVVLEYPEPLSPIGSGPFSLSPDGRHLLCVRVDPSNSDIFRVEPFR